MRRLLFLIAGWSASLANAQAIVTSTAPDRVAVTVYRNPDRGTQDLNLNWLGGVAMVSETRRVSLPAGESELRFEGVTGGIVPQTAIVTGLGEAVIEKNRDARLLSPGALLDAYLAQRVQLRRTSNATGQVRTQEAVIRATNNGVVIQTGEGFEALRCTGIPETLIAPTVPADLSARPTLSVRVRSPRPVEAVVNLAYISNNFDWQADYVADLSPDGKRISLFGWLTMANGDETGLADAATQAVAGRVNYQRVWVEQGAARSISINCWPSGTTTSDLGEVPPEVIVVTGSRISYAAAAPPPPPPPPPPSPERDGGYMAQEERFGDLRLYRVPIAVTVAAKSQKQIALMRRPAVRIDSVLRVRPHHEGLEVRRVLVTRNRTADGLGLALPAGKVALFGPSAHGRILLGEGRIDDVTIGEKVEIQVATETGVQASLVHQGQGENSHHELTLTNDLAEPQVIEVVLPLEAKSATKLVKRDGLMLWRVTVPPNGQTTLSYRL